MYIEFKLPTVAGGLIAGQALYQIKQELEVWSMRYQVPYTQKTIKYTHRVGLNKPEHFSLFSLTWAPSSEASWFEYQIIDIVNQRY